MILTRRRFLQGVAASTLFVAPAIVRSESLMKIFVPGERVKFRVPDLRGHFATDPEPMNLPPQREMTATEVLERREEYAKDWTKRWGGHMNLEMSRKEAQDESMRNLNAKIDNDIFNALDAKIDYVDSAHDKLTGHQVTGVWVDESDVVNNQVAYHIHHKTGETQAFTDHPMGWIPCDGRELSSIEHPDLYQVLGNKYG